MRKIAIYSSLATLLLESQLLQAQAPSGDVYMIDMSTVLPYVLGFYGITFLAMGLLLLKLVRPKFSSRIIYVLSLVGIIGAAVVSWSFKGIQNTQLPAVQHSDRKIEELSPKLQEKLRERELEVFNQQFADFWIIAIPNFIILGLIIFIDMNNRKRDPNEIRGRYD